MAEVTRWGLSDKVLRNTAAVADVLNGKSCRQVARAYGISSSRVAQLVAKYCQLANKEEFAKMPACVTANIPWLRNQKDRFLPRLLNQRSAAKAHDIR